MKARPERRRAGTALASFVLNAPEPLLRRVGGPPVVLDGRVLNVKVQALLKLGDTLRRGQPAGDVAAVRAGLRQVAVLGMPVRTGVHVCQRLIPGPGGDLALRLYRRFDAAAEPPAIVYLHGGGWAAGDLDTHDGSCRLLADESGSVVVAVDYRLAPEHPFPAAVDDALCAYRWVRDNAAEISVSAGRIGVMGDSAGGNLAAAVSLAADAGGVPAPWMQCLVYPALDATMSAASFQSMGGGPWLSRDEVAWFRSLYLPDPNSWESPLASPGLVEDVTVFPPSLVFAAGFDPLRDEAAAFARSLAAAGVPVRYRCYDDHIHGYFGMGVIREALAIAVEICRAVGREMDRSA